MKFYLRILVAMVLFHILAYVYVVQLFTSSRVRKDVIDVDTKNSSNRLINANNTIKQSVNGEFSRQGKLQQLLQEHLVCLEEHRRSLLSSPNTLQWRSSSVNINRLHATDYHFFSVLNREFPHIKSCHLVHNAEDTLSLLNKLYYPISSRDCDKIILLGGSMLLFYNVSCTEGMSLSLNAVPVSWRERSLRLWKYAGFLRDPIHVLLTYVNVIPNAVIDMYGDVMSHNVSIVPARCDSMKFLHSPLTRPADTVYAEVFSIHLVYGQEFSTNTFDNIVRLAPYLSFLQKHQDIMLHNAYRHPYLPLLGISLNRLIPVNMVVRASVAYVPAGSHCNTPALFNAQILRQRLRQGLSENQTSRNVILFLKLTKFYNSRSYITVYDQTLRFVKKISSLGSLEVVEYSDATAGSMDDVRELFNRALIVVSVLPSPDISHMFFSQTGSVLIEGLCQTQEIRSSQILKFASFAQSLGLRYHGVFGGAGCRSLQAAHFTSAIGFYVKQAARLR